MYRIRINAILRTTINGIIDLKKVFFSQQAGYSFEHIVEAQSHS